LNALDHYTEIERGLWIGGCPQGESPDFAEAVLDLFGRRDYVRRCQVHREEKLLDLDVPETELLEELARWVHDQRTRELTVLIHCEEGRNRSALITALYLIRHKGMQPEGAIGLIREKRGPSALYNGSFVRYLRSLGPREFGEGS
jgi:hypothetical protein